MNIHLPDLAEKSVVSPTIVGRAAHLQALGSLLQLARAGQGQAVLLSGEAGIGKTRLITETRASAQALGFAVHQGSCFEPDRSLPYAPLLDLLRAFLAGRPPQALAADLGPSLSELAALLPELPALLPDWPGWPANPLPEGELDKHRLFSALERFFARLASQGPLLMVLEDIHWSDDTSLDFMLHLSRRLSDRPMLILMTYRIEDDSPALARFLAALDRARQAHELRLEALAPEDVHNMLRAIFGIEHPVSPEFLDTICRLTEGNPFFIEEVLKSLLAAGDIFRRDGRWDRKPVHQLRIPRSVQLAVQQRAEQLGPDARQVLDLAVVAGRRFSFSLLQELSGMPEQTLLVHLKHMVAAQLIADESAEHYAFRHALVREAAYATLLRRERQRIHEAIAQTLERMFAGRLEAHLADLAYHYYKAESWAMALEFSQRAGQRAQALYAPREAAELFTQALHAADQLALPTPAALSRARGQVYETLGDFDAARADYQQALDMARQSHDLRAEWQGLIDLGFLWAARDYQEALGYFQAALALARSQDDAALLAHSLNRLGNWRLNMEQPLDAAQYHQQALAIFQRLDDRAGQAATLDLLGITASMMAESISALAYYQQAVALFTELNDRQALVSSLAVMANLHSWHGSDAVAVAAVTPVEALQYAAAAVEQARLIAWHSGEAYAFVGMSLGVAALGRFEQGLEHAHRAFDMAEQIGHRQWMSFASLALGIIHADMLALPAAQQYMQQAVALGLESNSPFWVRIASSLLASIHIEQNDLAKAEEVLQAAAPPAVPARTYGEKLCWVARLELALARGQTAEALDIGAHLMDAVFANAPQTRQPWQSAPRLLLLYGQALAAARRYPEARANLQAALEAAQAQAVRPLLWRIHLVLGRLLRVQRQSEAAEIQFAAARDLILELALEVPDHAGQDNFRQHALALLPQAGAPDQRRAAKRQFGGLTARERHVASLVGLGQSNRDIAASLVLSQRTVEKHVSNILAKLDLSSRAQLVAWAVEHGLGRQN